ncbi:MAG: hypothetical protein GXY77_03920 [Fibrobacter sp.]|nr:hypothetical protein [Fibrobacter sp.]
MKHLTLLLIPFLSFFIFCTKDTDPDALVRIGKTSYSKEQLETFRKVSGIYPSQSPEYFPGKRSLISQMVETEVIYKKASRFYSKNEIKNSLDWKWQQKYYPAQFFMMEFLSTNLNISEDEIKNYYEANKESFKVETKADSSTKDSTDSLVSTEATAYKSLSEVKGLIVETLFFQKYLPDSSFVSRFDSTADSSDIARQWLRYANANIPDFFMRQFYKEKYGRPYQDSISEVLGKEKIVQQQDVDLILSWIPEKRKSMYETENGKKDLVEWLLKWKLISEAASESGFTSSDEMKNRMDWAWKIALVYKYLKEEIIPQVKNTPVEFDTSIVEYAVYDETGNPSMDLDSFYLHSKIKTITESYYSRRIDSIIYDMRKDANIEFLQNDHKDNLDQNPAALLKQADSLRDTSNIKDAEKNYRILAEDFAFTPEGKNALIELAKLQTEKQQYLQAIRNYRNYLITDHDKEKRCNTFFMIGFIYDEYMNMPQQAEINYKWILKNTPGCELSDDAEFMLLHLDEPMNSVEELQAEAIRQGRQIDDQENESQEEIAETAKSE